MKCHPVLLPVFISIYSLTVLTGYLSQLEEEKSVCVCFSGLMENVNYNAIWLSLDGPGIVTTAMFTLSKEMVSIPGYMILKPIQLRGHLR